jgi:glycosyltransferase involved in cell wall biosynthesis
MKKRLAIIYSKNPEEVVNRKAALGSYIYALGGLFQENNYEVSINGKSYAELKQTTTASVSRPVNQSTLKKMIPAAIKRMLKDLQLFGKQKAFNEQLKQVTADVVLEFYSYGSTSGYEMATQKKIPLFVIYDAPVLDEYQFFNEADPFFLNTINVREKQTLLLASTTVTYSHAVKKYVWKKIGKEIPVQVHQNIDFTRFDFLEQKPIGGTLHVGFIGSFLQWHRVDLLLNAFTRLKTKGYDLRLYLLGTGEAFEAIKKQVTSNAYKDHIVLPGFVDGEELKHFKTNIQVGVMPGSNWYGAPNKIFEYGASHMAVIAPDTPTITELFTDTDVLLFKNNSETGLYEALKYLCDHPEVIPQRAENLYQKIQANYSKSNTFEFYNRLIMKVIK